MEQVHVLGVDIGTSSVKAGIISSAGQLLWWHRESFNVAGTDPFSHWQATIWLEALTRLFAGLDPSVRIDAISISGNGPTLVPVGSNGLPVAPVLHWIDRREDRKPDQPSFFLPKAAWFMNHQQEAYEATRLFLTCPEYIVRELTGESASVIPSLEFQKYQWELDAIRAYGLEPAMFPDHLFTGDRVGSVTAATAGRWGLPVGVPVFAGGSDFLMALLGTAAVRTGKTCDRAGTSEGINYCSSSKVNSTRLRTLPHVIEGNYNVAGILSSTGRIFEWFRRIAGFGETAYEEMLSEISAVGHEATRPLFIPSLHVGATWEFSGAAFMHLEPEHGARELGRAVVESIGFAVRDLVETLERSGCRIDELRVSGGQARSAVWNQMKADITGKPVWAPAIVDAELTGNAAAGMMGLGLFGSLQEASEELVEFVSVYEPRKAEYVAYSDSYSEFMDACGRVVGILADYLYKPST